MNAKLKEFALVAEMISASAIVASLVFVGVQIQQNSKINEVNAYQNLISQITTLNAFRVEDREFAVLYGRYVSGEEITSSADRQQLIAMVVTSYRHSDLAYRQYRNGIIDEQTMISALGPTRGWLRQSIGKESWAALSAILDPEFVNYLNELTSEENSVMPQLNEALQ